MWANTFLKYIAQICVLSIFIEINPSYHSIVLLRRYTCTGRRFIKLRMHGFYRRNFVRTSYEACYEIIYEV